MRFYPREMLATGSPWGGRGKGAASPSPPPSAGVFSPGSEVVPLCVKLVRENTDPQK